jgi:hypothetical protein
MIQLQQYFNDRLLRLIEEYYGNLSQYYDVNIPWNKKLIHIRDEYLSRVNAKIPVDVIPVLRIKSHLDPSRVLSPSFFRLMPKEHINLIEDNEKYYPKGFKYSNEYVVERDAAKKDIYLDKNNCEFIAKSSKGLQILKENGIIVNDKFAAGYSYLIHHFYDKPGMVNILKNYILQLRPYEMIQGRVNIELLHYLPWARMSDLHLRALLCIEDINIVKIVDVVKSTRYFYLILEWKLYQNEHLFSNDHDIS